MPQIAACRALQWNSRLTQTADYMCRECLFSCMVCTLSRSVPSVLAGNAANHQNWYHSHLLFITSSYECTARVQKKLSQVFEMCLPGCVEQDMPNCQWISSSMAAFCCWLKNLHALAATARFLQCTASHVLSLVSNRTSYLDSSKDCIGIVQWSSDGFCYAMP